jgi:choloylglycine hydrolase
MDWAEDMHSNLWVFPRGMQRSGAAGPTSVSWTSKYGSLVISAYDLGTTDGMNEKGLVMNGLYLSESDYGKPDDRPAMSVMIAGQFVLDSFGTVAEAVAALRKDAVRLIAPTLPNGRGATVHLSLSDPTGDSAIFEWLDGKLVVHHGKEFTVMTNSPRFEDQLAIEKYWKGVDPLTFLPGSINAADRFARVSFLINAIPKKADPNTLSAVPGGTYENQAVASVLSVMRSIGVPLGITHPSKPNISSTLWRTVWDHKHRVLYFDSATTPNAFWVPLAELNFDEGAPIRKLHVADGKIYAGNAAGKFESAKPFPFLAADRN